MKSTKSSLKSITTHARFVMEAHIAHVKSNNHVEERNQNGITQNPFIIHINITCNLGFLQVLFKLQTLIFFSKKFDIYK